VGAVSSFRFWVIWSQTLTFFVDQLPKLTPHHGNFHWGNRGRYRIYAIQAPASYACAMLLPVFAPVLLLHRQVSDFRLLNLPAITKSNSYPEYATSGRFVLLTYNLTCLFSWVDMKYPRP